MTLLRRLSTFLMMMALLAGSFAIHAQRAGGQPAARPIIFAVLNDGMLIEPIAHVEKGKLSETVSGGDETSLIEKFNQTYYGAKNSYRLIFGGANAGTVTVTGSDSGMDCGPNLARVKTVTRRTPLKGKVMALATNAAASKPGSGVRRLPTWPERNDIDALVRAEFARHSVEVKKLDYHNLTALDVDNDKRAELVGSFWAENDPLSRTLLFFIAERGADGKLELNHTDLRTIKEDEVMSGDITALDEGVYHELLLDVFDYDGDGVSEIFTYVQAFEGSGFNVYKRMAGKWTKVFEGSNYHCGF
ncbi:MAG TPA: hypothetical protein PKD24_09375 [Pyrinomonadaceae bacterium]|nr:hypothetical protein [Pyrinomonadaceae bacterium]HMP65721.1 hypothetical protein [Pyrinomonadaceae bacterium]